MKETCVNAVTSRKAVARRDFATVTHDNLPVDHFFHCYEPRTPVTRMNKKATKRTVAFSRDISISPIM